MFREPFHIPFKANITWVFLRFFFALQAYLCNTTWKAKGNKYIRAWVSLGSWAPGMSALKSSGALQLWFWSSTPLKVVTSWSYRKRARLAIANPQRTNLFFLWWSSAEWWNDPHIGYSLWYFRRYRISEWNTPCDAILSGWEWFSQMKIFGPYHPPDFYAFICKLVFEYWRYAVTIIGSETIIFSPCPTYQLWPFSSAKENHPKMPTWDPQNEFSRVSWIGRFLGIAIFCIRKTWIPGIFRHFPGEARFLCSTGFAWKVEKKKGRKQERSKSSGILSEVVHWNMLTYAKLILKSSRTTAAWDRPWYPKRPKLKFKSLRALNYSDGLMEPHWQTHMANRPRVTTSTSWHTWQTSIWLLNSIWSTEQGSWI